MISGVVIFSASMAFGQFGLPKIPKIPKLGKQDSKPPAKAQQPKEPMPEVKTIEPNLVPPAWEGDVVLTGKNFGKAMKLRLECGGHNINTKDLRVESAERAMFHVKLSGSDEESTCAMAVEVPPGGAMAEIAPTPGGTVEVVQVTGATFAVSNSSKLPQTYKACFLAEGDVPYMQLMMKMAQKMQTSSQDECKLVVSSDSVKYVAPDKTVLDSSASGVKTVEQILMMGNPSGIFRIILANGKIFNFMVTESSGSRQNSTYEAVKKKLNK
jgi:hypothetical protein